MKIILTLLMLQIFTLKKCNSETINSTIEYSIFTRGTYKKILIENQKMYFSKEREIKGEEIIVSKEDWTNIITLFESLDLEKIQGLKGNGSKRATDRSYHANFSVIKNGKTYQTNEFDHGNPPIEIEALVNIITKFLK
jgi:hypothetical protein